MLILTRFLNEKVIINVPGHHPITVMVAKVGHDHVRLAFEAPPDVKIFRNEINAEAMARQNSDA